MKCVITFFSCFLLSCCSPILFDPVYFTATKFKIQIKNMAKGRSRFLVRWFLLHHSEVWGFSVEYMGAAAGLIYKALQALHYFAIILCITLNKVDFGTSARMFCALEFSRFQNRGHAFDLNLVFLSCFVQSCVSE